MGTITKLDGDQLSIDPLGETKTATVTLADDLRVIKRGASGREDGARSDLDTGTLVVVRGPHDGDDAEVDTVVVLQPPST